MFGSTVTQWGILDEIYHLFVEYPIAFFMIPVAWIILILVFQRVLHVHISPWIALMILIVSAGIVIGILLTFA